MVHDEVASTEELRNRSHATHSEEMALVVNPQRDIDRIERLLSESGLGRALGAQTHMHNDYVTGSLELATGTGATHVLSGVNDPV